MTTALWGVIEAVIVISAPPCTSTVGSACVAAAASSERPLVTEVKAGNWGRVPKLGRLPKALVVVPREVPTWRIYGH